MYKISIYDIKSVKANVKKGNYEIDETCILFLVKGELSKLKSYRLEERKNIYYMTIEIIRS